ncbi:cobW-domain-containing protein [Irpex rosettiformis]|uniref:CobW-domain-containing protein n=1 Tax=Irpex rosettiformis TaxID=378272 RepID=A0ACB8U2W9_9APHY|nr:cobW-domain-containing protein [Irpex rosettiformis]
MDEDDIPMLVETVPGITEAAPAENTKTVPLTIICGFLGAGKSTLIRRILSERHGYRIAVIMNDFGDTADIEAKTINVAGPEDPNIEGSEEVLELANGCLCCSIKDTGVAAIEKLMQRKGAFDHILLETTGLADPGPIASLFWQNEEYSMGLGRDIHLDGVVCVVDAVFAQQQIEEDHSEDGIGESLRQIACADVILLNKTDIAPIERITAIESQIAQLNPTAIVHRTVRGQIDLKHLMGIKAYATGPIPTVPVSPHHEHSEDEECDHPDHKPAHHYELRGISSLQITCPTLSDSSMDALDEWIRTVLWEGHLPGEETSAQGITILRCKGMFRDESGKTHILQGVRDMYEITTLEDKAEEMGIPDEGKVVFIGKGLVERVRKSLVGLLSSSL